MDTDAFTPTMLSSAVPPKSVPDDELTNVLRPNTPSNADQTAEPPSWVVDIGGLHEKMTTTEIGKLIARGIVSKDTRVRELGRKKWRQLSSIRALNEALEAHRIDLPANFDSPLSESHPSTASRDLDAKELWAAAGVGPRKRTTQRTSRPAPALDAAKPAPIPRPVAKEPEQPVAREPSTGSSRFVWIVVVLLALVLALSFSWGAGLLRF
jgi:uncharacterized membrane protein